MVLETSSIRLRCVSVSAVYPRRHGSRAPSTPENSPSVSRRPHFAVVLAEFARLNKAAYTKHRWWLPSSGYHLQNLFLHLNHSRFVSPHAVASKFIGFLAASSQRRSGAIRCAKFHIGQVSYTISLLSSVPNIASTLCGPHFVSQRSRVCGPTWILLTLGMLHEDLVI